MGKHEREAIQELEESVCSLLNGQPSLLSAIHPWSKHDHAIAERIAQDFPGLLKATTAGNSYETAGDIDLELDDGRAVNLELKASASKAGRGTAANISQNALTEYGLVPGAESWSEFRKSNSFDDRAMDILDRHPASRDVGGKEAKGRAVKDAREAGDTVAGDLLEEVRTLADADRKAYMAYLSGFDFDEARVRLLVFAILTGNHRKGQIKDLIGSGIPLIPTEVPANYSVYFSNEGDAGQILVSTLDRTAVVEFLSVENLRVRLGNDEKATSHVEGELGSQPVTLLNFILHWKNISLGIKTPCINIFLGEFVQGLIN